MSNLTEKQLDLLDLLEEDQKLQFYTFKRIEGLKWFDELKEREFLEPNKNPKPVPGDEEGFYSIPTWDILKYLLNTSKELSEPRNEDYIRKYLDFIREVTLKTSERDPVERNYRTWWYFSQILSNVPPSKIKKNFIEEIVSKWFNDTFDTGLIVDELGKNLLPKLIGDGKKNAALELLGLIVKVKENKDTKYKTDSFSFRSDQYQVKSVLNNHIEIIVKLGTDAIKVLEKQLRYIFENSKEDSFSTIWRPAIEDHDQNEVGQTKAKNVLISAIRDILKKTFGSKFEDSVTEHINDLLNSEYVTFKRIAILLVNIKWDKLKKYSEVFLSEEYFSYHYQHELYWFLKDHFDDLSKKDQGDILKIINDINAYSDEEHKEQQIAYKKLRWLTAIKDSSNTDAIDLYNKNFEIVGREPAHPDFSSYMESGFVQDESPIGARDILSMEPQEIKDLLDDFEEDQHSWKGPTRRGLENEFRKTIKSDPNRFINEADEFLNLGDNYLSQFFEAFKSLWKDEKAFKVEDSLNFCLKVTEEREDLYQLNYSRTLGSISEFIEEGTKSDENAFQEELLTIIDEILKKLLSGLKSQEFEKITNTDPVTKAINSDRGKAIEALINYSLRRCRLANKKSGDHQEEWKKIEHFYDDELSKIHDNNFEFHALITRYSTNILYLSSDWLSDNLDEIFTKDHKANRLAAVNGFVYSKYVNEIFEYLVDQGIFIEVLDDGDIKNRQQKTLINYASINHLISEESKAVYKLIERWDEEELAHLVWCFWRANDKIDEKQKGKIIELWDELYEKLQDSPLEKLLSNLNYWAVYIEEINSDTEKYLTQSAPYACLDYNAPQLLEELNRLVDRNPKFVANIYLAMLSKCVPTYKKDHILHIIEILDKEGLNEEIDQINKRYLENKVDFVATHLNIL